MGKGKEGSEGKRGKEERGRREAIERKGSEGRKKGEGRKARVERKGKVCFIDFRGIGAPDYTICSTAAIIATRRPEHTLLYETYSLWCRHSLNITDIKQ